MASNLSCLWSWQIATPGSVLASPFAFARDNEVRSNSWIRPMQCPDAVVDAGVRFIQQDKARPDAVLVAVEACDGCEHGNGETQRTFAAGGRLKMEIHLPIALRSTTKRCHWR